MANFLYIKLISAKLVPHTFYRSCIIIYHKNIHRIVVIPVFIKINLIFEYKQN